MSAEVFSEYLEKKGKRPALFFSKVTSLGVFNIRNVEAKVLKRLEPIEKFALGICQELKAITRIELFVLSGHSMEICEETLNLLEYHDMIELVEFDKSVLKSNIDRISANIGEEWITPTIQRLLKRKYLKTYALTKIGEKALRMGKKLILDSVDLDLMITSKPLHLVYEKAIPKSQGYENIEMTPDMIYTLLTFASEFSNVSGVEPISLTPSTIGTGAEIVTSNIWIGLEELNGKNNKSVRYHSFISSNALEKWISLETSDKLIEYIPKTTDLKQIVTNSISYSCDIVQELVYDGLTLENENLWKFTCDLEMLMLVNHFSPDPIRQVRSEIRLKTIDLDWDVIIKIELIPEDDLAFSGLSASRFHSNVSRGGFRISQGYELWQDIFADWKRSTSYSEYKTALDLLAENNCLREILPKIFGIVIDAGSVLSLNKRGSQHWEFNRLRQIESLLNEAGINNRIYVGTNNTIAKIDEDREIKQWIDDGLFEVVESNDEVHPVFQISKEKGYCYLGNRKPPTLDEFKEMRRNSQFIKFNLEGKKIVIHKLEPFYEFMVGNILDLLYDHYYE